MPFPRNPNMPGMLQLEANISKQLLYQFYLYLIIKCKIVYIAKASDISFKQKVVSGNKLYISTKFKFWKRGIGKAECEAYVDKKIVSSAKFDLVLNSELETLKLDNIFCKYKPSFIFNIILHHISRNFISTIPKYIPSNIFLKYAFLSSKTLSNFVLIDVTIFFSKSLTYILYFFLDLDPS